MYAQVNIYKLTANSCWIHNLLEDINSLKSQMVNNNNSDARLFLINETNHLIWPL